MTRIIACILFYVFFFYTLLVAQPFITTWKTDNPGESDTNQIMIPGTGENYMISWEEIGNSSNNGTMAGNDTTTVTFPTPGIYQVSISPGAGDFTRIQFSNSGDPLKLLTIEQWGEITWSTMESAFSNCANMTCNAIDAPDLSSVSSLHYMFLFCSSLTGDFNHWDVSNITNMDGLFVGCSVFNSQLSNWNTSQVTSMRSMFSDADSFNQDISGWDVSNVKSMEAMFAGTQSFNQDIGGWNVANDTSMVGMFSGSNFNRDISSWDVSSVTTMWFMFDNAPMFNQNISTWDVSNVTNMGAMIRDADAFDQNLGDWDVTSVTNLSNIFDRNGLSTANYDSILIGWATQAVSDNLWLGADGLSYCNATEARQSLIDNHHWHFYKDTLDCSAVGLLDILPSNTLKITNYPNPFYTTTTIGYTLPRTGFVLLRLIDLSGRLIRTLIDEKETAGTHTFNWEEVLPAGVYFCTIEVDGCKGSCRIIAAQ